MPDKAIEIELQGLIMATLDYGTLLRTGSIDKTEFIKRMKESASPGRIARLVQLLGDKNISDEWNSYLLMAIQGGDKATPHLTDILRRLDQIIASKPED